MISTCHSKQFTRLDWVGPLLLCREEVGRIPSCVPGVYLLHAFAPDLGAYPAFYVGRSQDLRRRLLEHLGLRTTKPAIRAMRELERAYWSAAPVPDPFLRAGVESSLVRLLAPPCNDQTPAGDTVLVSLPPMSIFPLFP